MDTELLCSCVQSIDSEHENLRFSSHMPLPVASFTEGIEPKVAILSVWLNG